MVCLVLSERGVSVCGVKSMGAVVVGSVSSSEDVCSNKECRQGPIRALRVCMASDVSLPLVCLGDVLFDWLFSSSLSAIGCGAAEVGGLCAIVLGLSSARWSCM